MNRSIIQSPCFEGIIPPMVTPLLGPDQLDIPGLERLLEHILAGGVHGLFILGTTGEGPSLSYQIRRELIRHVCRLMGHRVPVLVGVTDTSYSESIALARYAKDCGADAVVIAPPYYFPAGQAELLEYFDNIIEELPLPVMLYNMPGCTKISIGMEIVRRILEKPQVVGLKDSSGHMSYFQQVSLLISEMPKKSLLVGPEELLAETTLLGSHGGVCGGANLFPRLYVDLYTAAKANDMATVRYLHHEVLRVSQLYRVGQHSSSIIKGIKCSLNCMGICSDYMAEPFRAFQLQEREQIAALLKDLNRLTLSVAGGD